MTAPETPSDTPSDPEAASTQSTPDAPEPAGSGDAETAWQRKRRLAAIFGDVLPETTRDDRDESSGESGTSEEWLRRQVPPHHG